MSDANLLSVTSFYRFVALGAGDLEERRDRFRERAEELGIRGLVILAAEGVNGTVAGTEEAIRSLKELICSELGVEVEFKDSSAPAPVFKRLSVQVREEIVTIKETLPQPDGAGYLDPADWDAMMGRNDVVVIDTRNVYETRIGKFRGAIDPNIRNFSEFPAFVDSCGIPQDKKILMYCTGGIRCEKASLSMRLRGYSEVYQLKGGILKYLEERPNESFDGECFVFDDRVALDQALAPTSRYKFCPHCGDPAATSIACGNCSRQATVCDGCLQRTDRHSCSKNCAYHLRSRGRAA